MTAVSLRLAASQETNTIPYQFKITNTKVYSLEEALFHVFHNWKQTVDDFCCREFISWVNNVLRLSYYATEIQELAAKESFAERLILFLGMLDYYRPKDLEALRIELSEWEKRMEWERLKERGDYSLNTGEPSKAIILYKRAMSYGRNPQLLNNTAVALMQMEMFKEAMEYLQEAVDLSGEDPPIRLLLNFAESAVYAHDFDLAAELLERAGPMAEAHELDYLRGELSYESGDPHLAAEYFERAISSRADKFYLYRLTDLYCKMRKHDQALEALSKASDRDMEYYMKLAEVQALGVNVPAAIKSIEKALVANMNSIELWIALARYHRMDYDLNRAQSAITKALSLDPENDRARIENAKIKKATGKTKDYQVILHNILRGFKGKYREIYE